MYEQYLRDPASVGEEWRNLFDNGKLAELPVIPTSREEALSGSEMRDAGRVPATTPTPPASRIPHPGLTPIVGPAARLVQNMTDSRSEEHTSELQSHSDLVCRLLLEKK